MPDMTPSDPPQSSAQPVPEVRFLKILVTALAVVMICGLVTIIALFVIRLGATSAVQPALPPELTLPSGAQAQAVTVAQNYIIVVTDQATVLFYRPDGTLVRTVPINN